MKSKHMLELGKTLSFEDMYTEKFRSFLREHGQFIEYSRDSGARDIGVQLTKELSDGRKIMTSTLCWFQLKGIMKDTYTEEMFNKKNYIPLKLEIRHLKYWYYMLEPTYLVLYLEVIDNFFIVNIQKYIAKKWGKGIFEILDEKKTIHIDKISVLDEHALDIIYRDNEAKSIMNCFGLTSDNATLCVRDGDVVYHIGIGEENAFENRLRVVTWMSKTRTELYIEQSEDNNEWLPVRNHWESFFEIKELDKLFPYFDFYNLEYDGYESSYEDDDSYKIRVELPGGDIFFVEEQFECTEFCIGLKLNQLGKELLQILKYLKSIELMHISDETFFWTCRESWNKREV